MVGMVFNGLVELVWFVDFLNRLPRSLSLPISPVLLWQLWLEYLKAIYGGTVSFLRIECQMFYRDNFNETCCSEDSSTEFHWTSQEGSTYATTPWLQIEPPLPSCTMTLLRFTSHVSVQPVLRVGFFPCSGIAWAAGGGESKDSRFRDGSFTLC